VDLNWRQIYRWSFLISLVMLIWLVMPATRCSWKSFWGTPLSAVDEDDEELDDPHSLRQEVDEPEEEPAEPSFISKLSTSVKGCYADHSIGSQETWKRVVFWLFLALGVLARFLHRRWANSRPTGYA